MDIIFIELILASFFFLGGGVYCNLLAKVSLLNDINCIKLFARQ